MRIMRTGVTCVRLRGTREKFTFLVSILSTVQNQIQMGGAYACTQRFLTPLCFINFLKCGCKHNGNPPNNLTFVTKIKPNDMKHLQLRSFLVIFGLMAIVSAAAQNPFVQTWCTSDPAPLVHDGTMYVYTGHDEEGADFFWMQEWRVYSTQDMVNWQDHGSPLALESFSWADDRAWASQTIERDGKFYWYICAHSKISGGMAIGVAVGDSPTGPFKDAIGKPLFENGSWDHIDPTVMIDDDGQGMADVG